MSVYKEKQLFVVSGHSLFLPFDIRQITSGGKDAFTLAKRDIHKVIMCCATIAPVRLQAPEISVKCCQISNM
jgi:hypothetical protein